MKLINEIFSKLLHEMHKIISPFIIVWSEPIDKKFFMKGGE